METGRMKLALSAGALALSMALAGCGGGGSSSVTPQPVITPGGGDGGGGGATAETRRTQMKAITDAIAAATEAARGIISNAPTDDQVKALEAANMVLDTAIKDGGDLPESDITGYRQQHTDFVGIATLARGVIARTASVGDLEMRLETVTGERSTANQVSGLFATAATQRNHAETAQKEVEEALKAAKENSEELTPISVVGDSKKATENAQAVLDAEGDVADALGKAQKAKADATAAQTTANGLAAGTPGLERLKDEIKKAIDAADDAIEAIEAIQKATGPATLNGYVFGIEGSKGDGTPDDKGEAVAEAIESAFEANPVRIASPATDAVLLALAREKATATATVPIMDSDQPDNAMTWEQIVGASKIEKKAFGINNADVSVMSVTGMKLSDFVVTTDTPLDALPDLSTGSATIQYMGIAETLYCVGSCSLEDDNTLKGMLYFGPADVNQRYTKAPNQVIYTAYDLYATYGHWLTAETNGNITINTFAGLGDDLTGISSLTNVVPGNLEDSDTLADTATYEGDALGMSVHSTYGANSEQTNIESGAFTAKVSLTARFGDTPSLSGTVSDFEGVDNPNAVDPAWVVRLGGDEDSRGASLGTGTIASDAGTTRDATPNRSSESRGDDGNWTAQTYADSTTPVGRPVGIFGQFNAHFSDGHVTGAYATRND